MTDCDFLCGEHEFETVERFETIADAIHDEAPGILASVFGTYREMVEDGDTGAIKAYVDVFEIGMQFVSSILLHQLRERGARTEAIHDALAMLATKVLTIGTWREVFLALVGLGAEHELPLATRFASACRKPNRKLTAFGRQFDMIPKFRNEHVGHGTVMTFEEQRVILAEWESCLFGFLDALTPLCDFATFTVLRAPKPDAPERKYRVAYAEGAHTDRKQVTTDFELGEEDVYLIRKDRFDRRLEKADVIALLPFLAYTHPKSGKEIDKKLRTVHLFQSTTNKPRWLSYVSPGHPRRDTGRYTELFHEFLKEFVGELPEGSGWTLPKRKATTWEDVFVLAGSGTRTVVEEMAQKYDRELFVRRETVHRAFEEFLASGERGGFVLLGESGAGKTNTLCHLAEELLAEGHLAVLYNSKVFATVDLAERVAETFESYEELPALLGRLSALAAERDRQVVFLFDAVNECVAGSARDEQGSVTPADLIALIDERIVKRKHPRVKVVMSCRNYTWEEVKRDSKRQFASSLYFSTRDFSESRAEADEEISLAGFSDAEFEEAYRRYADRYDLRTTPETLAEPRHRYLRSQLTNPFRLKLVSECYRGREIPDRVDSLALLEGQLAELTKSVRHSEGTRIDSILTQFTIALRRRQADALPMYEIQSRERSDALKTAIYDEGGREFSKAFTELLDRGVLRIEKGTSFEELRFVFERFHEFLLARLIEDEYSRAPADRRLGLYEEEIRNIGSYAVSWGAVRNALILDFRGSGNDPELLVRLAESEVYGAQGVVMEVVDALAEESYESALDILGGIIETPPDAERAIVDLERQEAAIRKLRGKLRKRKSRTRVEESESLKAMEEARAELLSRIQPLLARKKTGVKILYDICRSRLFLDRLYDEEESPLLLLWKIFADPLDAVRDTATRHVYYLWTEHPDTAFDILRRMSESYLDSGILERLGRKRRQMQLEPCARLSGLILCDSLVKGEVGEKLRELRGIWMRILRHVTLRGTMKLFIRPIMRRLLFKGTTVVSEYVNNITEYQHFWDHVPKEGPGYTQETFRELVRFLDPDEPGFEDFHDVVVEGAALGDSFSNFLLERVLIAQGVRDYGRIAAVVDRIYRNPENVHPRYTEMSMLYVIFHTLDKMESVPEGPFNEYERYMRPWTERTFGYFLAHENEEANGGRPYKQYTLNWYGALHGKLYGDGEGDMPLFQEYLRRGFTERDARMFRYAVDNISMLAADFGYWRSALRLFEYTLSLFRRPSDLRRFEGGADSDGAGGPAGPFDVRRYLAETLATIRGHFGHEVDRFVMDDLASTSFPDFERFREDLMRCEARESIGDLMTHKFGNLWVYGIVNIDLVRDEIQRQLACAPDHKDALAWLGTLADRVLKVLLPRGSEGTR